jgi:CubicO group peptidase (beta-lactamase class C family)
MQTQDVPEMTKQLHGFEDFVHATMKDWKVPGVAVAIVKDGNVIYSKGFGLRNVANDQPVTSRTLFPIASCTKAFTTASIAILVDEGKLDWDTPVRTYLPTLKLYDAVTTERITPRDLVSHRSGLPRHDLMWYNSEATRQELFDRLQYLEPTKELRATWQYQNLMFMVAGYLVGQIDGTSWEAFVQERIFDRLGMSSSNFSSDETSAKASDFSHPYKKEKDEVKEIPFYTGKRATAPAGAIISSIDDMSKWVLLHLNKGKYGDMQIVSEGQLAQMHSPQIVIPDTSQYPELLYPSYGLGWFMQSYRGHAQVYHGGNIDGFSSLTTLLPHDNIGMVVLTNMSSSPVPSILTFNICDRLLGLDEVPWSARFKKDEEAIEEAEAKGKEKSASDQVKGTAPSHALKAYTGDYEHPGYGRLTIELKGDQLQCHYNAMVFPLKHYHYDIFELEMERWEMTPKVSFSTNIKGDIDSLTAPFETTVTDITFKRVPGKEMRDKRFLEQFVGVYEIMSMTMTIALKGNDALIASIPGQPDYELVPYKDTEFHVKGLSGFSIEFKGDDAGGMEALITQPYGVFTAKKKTV